MTRKKENYLTRLLDDADLHALKGEDFLKNNPKEADSIFTVLGLNGREIIKLENAKGKNIFGTMSFDEIKKYDLLSFKLVNKPRHVGIAVSKSFFLHQMAERLSCVEFLTDAYKRKVINVWRHQELS